MAASTASLVAPGTGGNDAVPMPTAGIGRAPPPGRRATSGTGTAADAMPMRIAMRLVSPRVRCVALR